MAGEDPQYLSWLLRQPCQAPGPHDCRGAENHHPTHQRATGHNKRRAHDHTAVRLCLVSHVPGVHQLAGPFKGMTRDQVRAWADNCAAANRARYLGETPANVSLGALAVERDEEVPW